MKRHFGKSIIYDTIIDVVHQQLIVLQRLRGCLPDISNRPIQLRQRGSMPNRLLIFGLNIMCALSGLYGCASAPERKTPDIAVTVPSQWMAGDPATASAIPSDTEWWHDFDDGRLDALVQEALEQNYNVKAAIARVDQAAAAARIAGAELLPTVSAGFQASRRRQNMFGIPIPGTGGVITTRITSYGVSLDTNWELDLWGRIRKGQSAAAAEVEAGWADLASLRLSIASQTVKAWFALIEAKQQVELAEQTVESYRTSSDYVRARYEEGVRSSLDVRLALTNLAGAEALLELRRTILDQTTRQLEILLGRYPAAKLTADTILPDVPRSVPGGLPSDLLIRRPDLLAAERRFAAAEARVSEARRAFFPRLTLTASGGTSTQQLADLTNGDFSVWSIAAGLVQPIFQGGRLIANLSLSNAVSDQALVQYANAILTAFGEVESALFAERALARRESFLEEAARQAEAARLLAERQYNTGLVDYITVLETQRRALTSRSEYISIKRERLDARVNLHLALGGGFELGEEWNRFLHSKRETQSEASDE
jgi:NodT family efflux transporter outer membrane factor (OMF) lipoprotein